MIFRPVKLLLTVVLSFFIFLSQPVFAQENNHDEHSNTEQNKSAFDPGELILDHILDKHEFHFGDYNGHPIAIPLPIILYSPQKGFSCFLNSKFEHGHADYDGYRLEHGKITAVDKNIKVYDFSLTRNVVQMFLAVFLFILIMLSIAKRYKRGGSDKAPSGFQNAMEVVIIFIRDEVAKSNLGNKYEKYLPYLLSVFFFILINNLFGLLPGSANVTGNIAFTLIMGLISFLVIVISANKNYWGHIFNPPAPGFVKPILIPVEVLSVFTKPFALIIRLFANMVAGHMMIVCLIMLIFIFAQIKTVAGVGFTPISLLFTVFIYLIEILVAFIQAFIFTNLTAVFIGQAIEEHHHDDAPIL